MLQLLGHIGLHHVHGHVARAFNHDLHILLPGLFGQLTQGAQLGKLGFVIRIGTAAGPQAIAQRVADVISLQYLGHLIEMRVDEILFVVGNTPLGHDGATARHDAGHAVGRQVDKGQAHTGMHGEVVHALLCLLNQRVAEDFPGQVFGHAAHLFQRLINWHRANRHWRVAHDPVACGVDVFAGRQIHHRVRAPADGPDQLFYLFLNAGCDSGVANVGVDLDQEVAANGHGLQLGVVDVGRDDRAAACHFAAHKLRRHDLGDAGAKAVACQPRLTLGISQVLLHPFQLLVLTDGHVFHLGGDDAFARIVHLGDVGTRPSAARLALQTSGLGAQGGERISLAILHAIVQRKGLAAFVQLGVTAGINPALAHQRQALAHVDVGSRVGVRAGGVVHGDRLAIALQDLAHRHLDVGAAAGQIPFSGSGKRLAGEADELG